MIPISDFATAEWPSVNGVKDMYFRSCGTAYSVNPHYQVRGILLTDTPPSISAGAVTPNPTDQPTDNPTTAEPSPSPSDAPSPAPTEAYWSIWENVGDSTTPEDTSLTCLENEARLGITSTSDEFGDYFSTRGDAWVSGGIKFGCQAKDSNWNCIASCFDVQDWSDKLYLTFLAKVEGTSPGCTPSVAVTGGGWPRHSSPKIYLEGSYVDAGTLVSTEFRRVFIPLDDFKTEEWPGLNAMYGMYFQTCGFDEDGGSYPLLTYHIGSVAITNEAIDVISMPPTGSPTPFVPDDILLATHRFVHTNWYPLFSPDREPDGKLCSRLSQNYVYCFAANISFLLLYLVNQSSGNLWYVADNNMWPDVGSASPHTATVHIPQGQSVVYSGSEDVKLDKIIVEGSLVIQPNGADVRLTASTIVVEEGGTLDILTSDTDSFTVIIEVDGALDHSTDPEEIMVGILALGGSLTIKGNDVSMKMSPLSQTALAGSSTLDITGHDYDVGDELVLPDTQEGLDVGHYNFPNNGDYQDQTEHCIIASVVGSQIVCESPLAYDHSAGSSAAYVSRSIVIKTSQSSTDRAHILHTAGGKFEVRNARLEDLGRTTTALIDSTVFELDETLKFHPNVAKMDVISQGTNQIARYALHAHHSLVEAYFTGNAVISSPRDGMVAHNSRVHMLDNVILDADGTGIFLEDGTETGPVVNNYIIGTGGGSRGHDDGRFSSQLGKDMAHGMCSRNYVCDYLVCS